MNVIEFIKMIYSALILSNTENKMDLSDILEVQLTQVQM